VVSLNLTGKGTGVEGGNGDFSHEKCESIPANWGHVSTWGFLNHFAQEKGHRRGKKQGNKEIERRNLQQKGGCKLPWQKKMDERSGLPGGLAAWRH